MTRSPHRSTPVVAVDDESEVPSDGPASSAVATQATGSAQATAITSSLRARDIVCSWCPAAGSRGSTDAPRV